MDGRRRLIVSADDFGMSAAVNAGVIRARREGVLTNASLMVNGQGFEEAAALARENPGLGVGLHLTLVQGKAVSAPEQIPLLAGHDGMLGNNAIWNGFRYFFLPGVRDQLRRELSAQLEKFLAAGLPLSHVDGHLTVHMHPTVLGILLDLVDRYGIRAVRLPREPFLPALRFDPRHTRRILFEGMIFSALSRHALPRLRATGVRRPDHMFGLHLSGHVTEAYLLDVLPRLEAGVTEIYCHAGLVDEESRRWRPAHYRPDLELAALTSRRVRDAIEAEGIELISYRDLAESR